MNNLSWIHNQRKRDNSIFSNYNVTFSKHIAKVGKTFHKRTNYTDYYKDNTSIINKTILTSLLLCYRIVIDYTKNIKEKSTYCTTETRYYPYPSSTTLKCYKGDYTFHCRYTIPTVAIMPY